MARAARATAVARIFAQRTRLGDGILSDCTAAAGSNAGYNEIVPTSEVRNGFIGLAGAADYRADLRASIRRQEASRSCQGYGRGDPELQIIGQGRDRGHQERNRKGLTT